MWLVYPRDWEFLYPSPTFHSQRNFNFHKWLTCNFPLWYPYLIQQTDNENTLTYQVEAIILILPQILKLNEYQINPVRWLINDCKYMKIICVNCGWTKGIWKWPSSYEHYLSNSENKAWKNSGLYGTSGINFHYCVTARITSIFVSSTIVHTYNFHIPYLPVYNARPCIIRTLIFELFFPKKKISWQIPRIKTSIFSLN